MDTHTSFALVGQQPMKQVSSTCGLCGKPLSDPQSIAVGYGPKCSSILGMTRAHSKSAKASKVQRSLFDGFRSDYTYAIFEGYLVIIDLNLGGTSVTNNAEGVLKEIWSEGILPSSVLGVIYKDTDGYYDELKISPEGRFRGFKAWHKLSAMEIIEEAAI